MSTRIEFACVEPYYPKPKATRKRTKHLRSSLSEVAMGPALKAIDGLEDAELDDAGTVIISVTKERAWLPLILRSLGRQRVKEDPGQRGQYGDDEDAGEMMMRKKHAEISLLISCSISRDIVRKNFNFFKLHD